MREWWDGNIDEGRITGVNPLARTTSCLGRRIVVSPFRRIIISWLTKRPSLGIGTDRLEYCRVIFCNGSVEWSATDCANG